MSSSDSSGPSISDRKNSHKLNSLNKLDEKDYWPQESNLYLD